MKTAVIIIGHGSKREGADETLRLVAADVKKSGGYDAVEHAFLQYARPAPSEALDRCIRQKVGRIVIVPFFTQSGAHVTRDIPAFAEKAREQYPDVDITVTEYVGMHPLMTKIVEDLVKKKN